jgi:hypothetical protein
VLLVQRQVAREQRFVADGDAALVEPELVSPAPVGRRADVREGLADFGDLGVGQPHLLAARGVP